MSEERLPQILGVAHLLLWTTFVVSFMGLLGDFGSMVRILGEATGFSLGIFLSSDGDAPNKFSLVLHVFGMFALGVILYLWHRGDRWMLRALTPTALFMVLLAPIGIPIAVLLLWMRRQPDLVPAMNAIPMIAGQNRAAIILVWGLATAGTAAIGGASLLVPPGIGFFVGLLAGVQQTALLAGWLWMLRARSDAPQAVMPPLPELHR